MPPPITTLLFDLDGTLVDSLDGIEQSMRAAFDKLGLKAPEAAAIRPHIGAPLRDILRVFAGDKTEAVLPLYHDIYATQKVGIKGTKPFPRIPAMLRDLKEKGITIFVATNKEQRAAEEVMRHLDLASLCDGVYGTLPSIRVEKANVIAHILSTHRLSATDVMMVGDRKYDVEGATKNGVKTIGITWGYGQESELRAANAAVIAHDPLDVVALV